MTKRKIPFAQTLAGVIISGLIVAIIGGFVQKYLDSYLAPRPADPGMPPPPVASPSPNPQPTREASDEHGAYQKGGHSAQVEDSKGALPIRAPGRVTLQASEPDAKWIRRYVKEERLIAGLRIKLDYGENADAVSVGRAVKTAFEALNASVVRGNENPDLHVHVRTTSDTLTPLPGGMMSHSYAVALECRIVRLEVSVSCFGSPLEAAGYGQGANDSLARQNAIQDAIEQLLKLVSSTLNDKS